MPSPPRRPRHRNQTTEQRSTRSPKGSDFRCRQGGQFLVVGLGVQAVAAGLAKACVFRRSPATMAPTRNHHPGPQVDDLPQIRTVSRIWCYPQGTRCARRAGRRCSPRGMCSLSGWLVSPQRLAPRLGPASLFALPATSGHAIGRRATVQGSHDRRPPPTASGLGAGPGLQQSVAHGAGMGQPRRPAHQRPIARHTYRFCVLW
jgi:hypothetical protein